MAKGTVNKVILIGRLGQDPELKYTQSGTAVANISIATNEVWKGKDGATQDRTEWHRLVLWGKLAEIAEKYLKKGQQAYFEGKLQTRSWEDKDSVKRYTTEIVVNNMQLLGTKSDNGGSGKGSPPLPADDDYAASIQKESDLPF